MQIVVNISGHDWQWIANGFYIPEEINRSISEAIVKGILLPEGHGKMSVVIRGFDKPKNCYNCRFNNSNCWCFITKGIIDRDDYTCNVSCPIEQLPKAESEGE